MVTVRELVASTKLPDGSQQRLQKVMQHIGYGEDEDVDDTMRWLTVEDVAKVAGQAGLDPPLTYGDTYTLLYRIWLAGELVLTVRQVLRGWEPSTLVLWPVATVCWCAGQGGASWARSSTSRYVMDQQGTYGACLGHYIATCAHVPGAPLQARCRLLCGD